MRMDRVNGREVNSMADLRAVANELEPGSAVSFIGRTPDGERTIVNYMLRR